MRGIDRLLARLEAQPDNVDIYFDLADAYTREGYPVEAKHILTRLLQKPLSLKDWGHAKRWLGFLYYRENDFCAATAIVKELLATNLDAYQMGQAHHLMGRCLLGKSYYAKQATLSEQYLVQAVQHLEQAAKLIGTEGEERAEILMAWGTALRLQSQFDEAIKVFNSALEMLPAESRMAGICYEQLGLAYSEGTQEYEKVILYLEQAIRILPDDDEPRRPLCQIYATLSLAYVWLQQYDKALASAQRSMKAVKRSGEDWKSQFAIAHRACGDAYYYSELDLSLAQKHYREYLTLLNNEELTERAQTLIKLANIDRMRNKHKRALNRFRKALALNASEIDYGTLYLVIGECAARLRDFKEAVQAYESAIEYSRDDKETVSRGYLYLGHSLFELKRYEEAVNAYRQGLKHVDLEAPERAELLKYLATTNELMAR
jgi:tetratricopeptide (TPR) repeat protein